MKIKHSIAVAFLLVLALAACRKQLPAANAPGTLGEITYLNVSEDLKAQISQVGRASEFSHVLVDHPDTTYVNLSDEDSIPYFMLSNPVQFPIPDTYNETTGIPWIKYSLLNQGSHQLILTDSGHHPVVQLPVTVSRDTPVSVWFMDSLGKYRGMAVPDIFNPRNDAAGLRVVDAAPDAGPVFFTINKAYVGTAGFPDTLNYGGISGFIQQPVTLQDSLRLRFYRVGDSADVLTKQTLIIQPGHAYTFVLAGYSQQHSYVNPHTGKRMTLNADVQVLLFKNN
jgi:hypothetical protein